MFLYWIESQGRYTHRKDEIPKGDAVDRRDIPTDTAGLMGFLNSEAERHRQEIDTAARAASTMAMIPAPEPEPAPAPPRRSTDACSMLSRMDSPGIDVDGVVEAIGKAKGYALKRYSGALAIRFQELGNI